MDVGSPPGVGVAEERLARPRVHRDVGASRRLQNPVGVGGADLHRAVAIARGDGDYIQLWAGQRQKHRGSVVDAGIAVDDDSVAHWSHPPDRFARPWPFMALGVGHGVAPGPNLDQNMVPFRARRLGLYYPATQARRHGPGDMGPATWARRHGRATPPTPQTPLSVARYGAKWRLSYWFTARGTAAGAGTK